MDLVLRERRNMENKILSQQDLYDVLPFGKTKTLQLIKSGELPLVKLVRITLQHLIYWKNG